MMSRRFDSCEVEGCTKESTRTQRSICEMHYTRKRRTVIYSKRVGRSICVVGDCESPVRSNGLCQKHRKRMDVHGSVDLPDKAVAECANPECSRFAEGYCKRCWERVKKHRDPNCVKRAHWTGDAASYNAVHRRLRVDLGRAVSYVCGCGDPAKQWVYEAMCIPCHKSMDLARIAGESA